MLRQRSPRATTPDEFSPLAAREEYALYFWSCEVFDSGIGDAEAEDGDGGAEFGVCGVEDGEVVGGGEVEGAAYAAAEV